MSYKGKFEHSRDIMKLKDFDCYNQNLLYSTQIHYPDSENYIIALPVQHLLL